MLKKKLLLLLMLFAASFLFAQTGKQQDKVTMGAYTIKVTTNPNQTYGYEIYEGGKLQVKQASKPYFSVPLGFNKKENALIVAKWQVSQLQQGKSNDTFLTVEEAKKQGVSDDDLQISIPKNN